MFTHYKPQPGGQELTWREFIPFGNAERTIDINPGYRGIYIRGGRGGGKSHIGAAIACTRAYFDPKSRGLISANEFGQLETSTLLALAEFAEQFNIPIYPKGSTPEETARMIARRRLCQIFDAQVLVLAASKFGGTTEKVRQGGRGIQIRWGWLDEWAVADQTAMNVLNAALGRGDGVLDGFFWITSTINLQSPFNWVYSLFDDPDRSEEKRKLYKSVVLLSSDNTTLPPDFVRTLENSYTPEMVRMELRGEYVVCTEGRAFPYFDRTKHVKPTQYNPRLPLLASLDFNRHPATAVLAQEDNGVIRILHEFYLLNADTFKLSQAICAKVSELSKVSGHASEGSVRGSNPTGKPFVGASAFREGDLFIQVRLYGDATGNIKTANSNLTNWAIVHNALTAASIPFSRNYAASNPPVVDTLNSANCLLYQPGRIEIDPSCKELIKDLEFVRLTDKGDLDKKADILRCQVSDGFRYLIHSLFPYRGFGGNGPATGKPLGNPWVKR